jgi:hypothetical protein
LTEYEKSKVMNEYVEAVKDEIRETHEQLLPESGNNSRKRGRPVKVDYVERVKEICAESAQITKEEVEDFRPDSNRKSS